MRALIRQVLDRMPYIGPLRERIRTQGRFPPGHFYSPIPSDAAIRTRLHARPPETDPLPGIALNTEQQLALLEVFRPWYADIPFPDAPGDGGRYHFDQPMFRHADAIFLCCFLRHVQPRRIIEVGSGFSSAVMLDTIDRFMTARPELTFIEPSPERLTALARPGDLVYATLLDRPVQEVPVEFFTSQLRSGDLLFIDSSHVLKCGSDVQYLLFDVLPRLPAGVHVHFHDVFRGFEYPRDWLSEGRHWNEDYALRAFLAFNDTWDITLFANYVVHTYRDWFAEHMPLCLNSPGGSLYLRRAR